VFGRQYECSQLGSEKACKVKSAALGCVWANNADQSLPAKSCSAQEHIEWRCVPALLPPRPPGLACQQWSAEGRCLLVCAVNAGQPGAQGSRRHGGGLGGPPAKPSCTCPPGRNARCRYFTTHPYTFAAPGWMSCPKGVTNCPAACYLKQVGLLPACLAAQGACVLLRCCACWRGCWRHGLMQADDVLSCHLIDPPPCPRTADRIH